jgi:hypothetical protein
MENVKDWGWTAVMFLIGVIGWFARTKVHDHKEEHVRMHEAIAKKASAEDVARMQANVEKLFDQSRQDKSEILGAINDVGEKINRFQVSVTEQLGKKVDREELRR